MTTSLAAPDFDYLRRFVHERSAIVLDDGKDYLVQSRLGPLARDHGCGSVTDLVTRVRKEPNGALAQQVVEAMTTNETSWFRDVAPFEAIRDQVLPDLIAKRRAEKALTIWSAACSTGQEPYTIAMILADFAPQLAGWQVRILASDLSRDTLDRAKSGRYTQLEVNRGLPGRYLGRHFVRHGAHWQVSDDVRSMVQFGIVNLASGWPPIPPCDLLLIRNVLIYFDLETKRNILGRAKRAMRPDGYLALGASETTLNIDEGFTRVQMGRASFYQITDAGRR